MRVFEKTHIIFPVVILAIFAILLWSVVSRINDFKDYHYLIAKNSSRNVSESISQYISERKRLVQVFANDNKILIQKSALNPDDETLKNNLAKEVKKYFPDYFSFTVTDKLGSPFYDDFDGLIGELCLNDIKSYVNTKKSIPRVHPHPDIYHYDLLATANVLKDNYMFFISFPADEISSYLKSAQAIGHKTILVAKEFENLIEVTVVGSRNKTYREDYRLAENELAFLLSESQVPGTEWTVYDLQLPDLFLSFAKDKILEAVIIFFIIVLVGLVLFLVAKKEEKKRIKAESVKSEFVAIVSHELRTPLTSINGVIKLIENEALGPVNNEIKKYLNMASVNIDRLTAIVNDILDVKKMESGEFDLTKEKISLVKLVDTAVKENNEYAKKFNAVLEFIKPDKDYMVYGDNERLMQVMSNLLSNAVKYGSKKDHVKISFVELAKNIRVNIEDHGSGILEENKSLIFEKFTQAHSREKEVVKGTGLGLNIIKNIIEKHDGMVSYEKGKITGTVFYFILPLIKD